MSDHITTATKRVMSAIVQGAPNAPEFPDRASHSDRPLGLAYTVTAIVVVVAVALAVVVTKLPRCCCAGLCDRAGSEPVCPRHGGFGSCECFPLPVRDSDGWPG